MNADQDPFDIAQKLRDHLDAQGFEVIDNENIGLEEFKRGAQHIARVLCAVREVN